MCSDLQQDIRGICLLGIDHAINAFKKSKVSDKLIKS